MSLKYKPTAVNGGGIPDHGDGANGLTDFWTSVMEYTATA